MKKEASMDSLDYKALGKRIKDTRKQRGMTQDKLGELCGLSAAHIGHIERGTRIPSLETVYTVACVLDVGVDRLLFDSLCGKGAVLDCVAAALEGKDEAKVKSFLSTVKALADKVDEL